jgi:hypothetical protein
MAAQPIPTSADAVHAEAGSQTKKSRPRMSTRNRLLFFLTAWLLVLMPFLFWWSTWFGRALTPKEMNEYLNDNAHPRHIQHAIVQLGQRMSQRDASAAQWYGDLVRLASNSHAEVRSTDAWVMGQDTSGAGFHEVLLRMLNDPSPMVRGNAALSLVRFGDSAGRAEIVSLLQPVMITTGVAGRIVDAAAAGTSVHQGGLVAKLQSSDGQTHELRSPVSGRVRFAPATGASEAAGASVATVDPGEEQVWEALRALYLIGQTDDLPAIRPYERELPEISQRVRQQAADTERAIQTRAQK